LEPPAVSVVALRGPLRIRLYLVETPLLVHFHKPIGCDVKVVSGDPDPKHVSTSFVERQNWTVRTNMRRYTRLSNGFSRSLRNHAASTTLNYFAYNFIKIHRTLRMSPTMAAGVTDRLWSVEDLVALWESSEQRRAERAA
jgi:hypothetical protein